MRILEVIQCNSSTNNPLKIGNSSKKNGFQIKDTSDNSSMMSRILVK